jgi:adenylylsulfate kinase
MKEVPGNIFTTFDDLIQRDGKEGLLNQRSVALWMTGLSGSGKTSIAKCLERMLHADGHLCQLLDGDNVRAGLCNNLGFSHDDRTENIRRISELTKLYVHSGLITINCFVSPTDSIRAMARQIIGADDFIEVFVNTPLSVCEARDIKGLYAKARSGEIKNFTGISAPFEEPTSPAYDLKTVDKTAEDCANELYKHIKQRITR